MPTYRIPLIKTLSTTVTVVADDQESAVDLALQSAPGGICAYCSGMGRSWSVDDGEWDILDNEKTNHDIEIVG